MSPTTAAHVRADLGDDVSRILDGGPSRVGVESTIVDVTGSEPAILRVGGVSQTDVERVLGREVALRTSGEAAAPGTLASHYAPIAHVEIVAPSAVNTRARELLARNRRIGLLAPAEPPVAAVQGLVVLDPPRDVEEYARVLYARMREADELGLDVILVVNPPAAGGLSAAVRDRVQRAAH